MSCNFRFAPDRATFNNAGIDAMQKILVVDDDAELLDLICLSLKDAGFSTVGCRKGVDALREARSFAPDLIVLDLVLPEMDGFTVCETLRKDKATAKIPVLILTGLTSQLNRFAGLESGACGYLFKPITMDKLIAKIRSLLSQLPESGSSQRACA